MMHPNPVTRPAAFEVQQWSQEYQQLKIMKQQNITNNKSKFINSQINFNDGNRLSIASNVSSTSTTSPWSPFDLTKINHRNSLDSISTDIYDKESYPSTSNMEFYIE